MNQVLYTTNYDVRRAPDHYIEDVQQLTLAVQENTDDVDVIVELPSVGTDDAMVAQLPLEEVIATVESVLLTGRGIMPPNNTINFELQEHLVNIEPWVRIGIVAPHAEFPCSSVLWATTEEIRLLLMKLMACA